MSGKGLRLDELIAARGALPIAVVLELGSRICEALATAWESEGGPERELSPQTVHLAQDGAVLASEIGLSTFDAPGAEEDGSYRSPESFDGFGASPESDVFVLGLILAEMIDGKPLLAGPRARSGELHGSGLEQHLESAGIPERLDVLVPGLGRVVQRCLVRNPEERWAGAEALAEALRRVRSLNGLPVPSLEEIVAAAREATEEVSPLEGLEISLEQSTLALETDDADEGTPAALLSTSELWSLDVQESRSGEVGPDDRAAASSSPAAVLHESAAEIRQRMSSPRLTRIDEPTQLAEDEPTFRAALGWFFRRVLLVLTLIGVLLFAVAYYGVFPGGTERLVERAWSGLPEGLRSAVPESWVEGTQGWWRERPHAEAGSALGAWLLPRLPESLGSELAPEPPTPAPSPGEPEFDGVVTSLHSWIEASEAPAQSGGKLGFTVDQRGTARSDKVRVVARRPGSEDVAGEGLASEGLWVPEGVYDVELLYREWDESEAHRGSLRGVRVVEGHESWFIVSLHAPVGFLKLQFEIDGDEISSAVGLEIWPQSEVPVEGDPPGAAPFEAPAGTLLGLPEGTYRVRATLREQGRAPSSSWVDARVMVSDPSRVRVTDLRRGELLDPTGPGLRIVATNFGTDVSSASRVLVFPRGASPSTGVAIATGPAGYYFDVPPGTWDVHVVYAPSEDSPELAASRVLEGLRIDEASVVRDSVDMQLPVGELRVELVSEGLNLSSAVRVVVLNPGASFEAASRVTEGEGRGPHAVPVGRYDIYAVMDSGPQGTGRAVFRDVRIERGARWTQRIDTSDPIWQPYGMR